MNRFNLNLKKILILALVIASICGIGRFCNIQTEGFTRAKICSNFPHNPEWVTPPLSECEMKEVKSLLDQPVIPPLQWRCRSFSGIKGDPVRVPHGAQQ